MVLGVCRRILDEPHAAEDAFQATFLILALKAHAIASRPSLGPWFHGVARRVALRTRRSVRERTGQEPCLRALIGPAAEDPTVAECRSILDEELGRLPEKYRGPVVLCYLEGKSQEEAARELGWTKGTVSGRLAKAKELLRARLTRRGLAPSVGLLSSLPAAETASATVPLSLIKQTVRVALVLGRVGSGGIVDPIVSLAQDGLRAMFVS
jgi:RNA polymerase sigma factor (sigma-70 family)